MRTIISLFLSFWKDSFFLVIPFFFFWRKPQKEWTMRKEAVDYETPVAMEENPERKGIKWKCIDNSMYRLVSERESY